MKGGRKWEREREMGGGERKRDKQGWMDLHTFVTWAVNSWKLEVKFTEIPETSYFNSL